MYVIRVNAACPTGYRQIAECELSTATQTAALEMFDTFCLKFPAPAYALSLTRRTVTEPVIGMSKNY